MPADPADRPGPEEMRARILEVAWDLFRQLGARTTIADIAEKLGMSSANVYRFYPSKQAVCEAIASNQLGALTDKAPRDRRATAAGLGANPRDHDDDVRMHGRSDAQSIARA